MAAFIGLDDTPSYTEHGGLTVLDDDATIFGAATYDGAILTLARDGGANPNDVFDGTGTLSLSDGQVLLQETDPESSESIDIIVGSYANSGGTLVITFNADATEARVNTVLKQLAYSYGGEAPPPEAVIDYAFNDGQSPVALGSITVTLVGENDPPSLDSVAPVAAYRPGSPGAVLSPSLVISDPDSTTLTGAVVRIVDRPDDPFDSGTTTDTPDADDVLSADPGGTGISVSYDPATLVLTLTGTATLDQYRQVLATVAYSSPDADPSQGGASTTRTIEWQLDDGGSSDNLSAVQTTTLHFTPTLDLDGGVAGDGFATAYTESNPAVPIADTDAVATNPAGNLTFATITLTNAKPGDSLAIAGTLPAGITGTVDTTSVPGQIIVGLGGAASPADYQAALRQVVFGSSSENPDTTPRDITVVVGDEIEISNTAHTTIAITALNDAPVAQAGSASGNEDETISGNAVATDVDNSAAQLTYSLVGANGGATQGTVSLNPDGSFTYAPAANFNGGDSFSFKANDGVLDSNTASIAIAVAPVNDAPVLGGDDAITVPEGGTVPVTTADLTSSDVDNSGAELVYTVTGASHGTVLKSGTETASFTQADLAASLVSFSHDGSELDGSFTVSLTDGAAAPQGATVTAAVSPRVNDAPVLGGDTAITVAEGGAVAVTTADLSATDPDNTDAQLVFTVTGTSHGTVLKSGTATTSFTQADLAGNLVSFQHDGSELAGSFAVSLTDGTAPAQSATLNAAVTLVNDAPALAGDLAITVPEGGTVAVTTADLAAADPDNTAAQLVYTITGTSHGTVLKGGVVSSTFTQADLVANLISFQHDGGELPGSFTVSLSDGAAPAQSATVNATINPSVNDAPTDITGSLAVNENSALGAAVGTVVGQDPENQTLTYALTDDAGGRFAIDNAGQVTVADGLLLDFEQNASHAIGVRVTDTGGLSLDKTFVVTVNDLNPEVVIGDPRQNILFGGSGGDYFNGAGGNDYLFGGIFNPDGSFAANSGNDSLDGGDGDDGLWGADGNDHLIGGAGSDGLVGGAGADFLDGGDGADFLFGGDFNPDGSFAANSGNDTLDGSDGNDGLWGADGNDILLGGNGSDGLLGGAGNDLLEGGDGADFLFGGDFSIVDGSFLPNSGDDTLNGGNGNDGLWGFDGNDAINGEAGEDYAEGGAGNDVILGGADNDNLFGQGGADTIGGGTGFDYLYGGAEADVFVFNRGDSFDTVWDFSAAEGDKVRLDPAFGIATLADLQAHLSGFTLDGADYSVISFPDSADQLTIKGIAASAFTLAMLDL